MRMESGPTGFPRQERQLLEAARRGDEDAFGRLVEAYRAELRAYCYEMLGSVHDAEDAVQDALLRAWRGLPRFQGRSSLRRWLYRIATNTCLDLIARRPKRVLSLEQAQRPIATGPTSPSASRRGSSRFPTSWGTSVRASRRRRLAMSNAKRSSSPS